MGEVLGRSATELYSIKLIFFHLKQFKKMSKDIFSRELRAAHEFDLSNMTMTDIIRSSGDANLISLYNDLSQAIGNFGYSEMWDRQELRTAVAFPSHIASKEAQAAPSQSALTAARFNAKGVTIAKDAMKSVDALIAEAKGVDTKPGNLARVQDFRSDFMSIIATGEMKADEVKQIQVELDLVLDLAKKGGEITVLNFIKTKTNLLLNTRLSAQKSAGNGIPAWKVVAIAIFLGVALFLLLRCLLKNKGCNLVEQIAKGKGKTILGLIRNLC
jgi:hypothetical protein